nr:UPF0481 protein At3g47200-like [Ipomoea batatas]
MAWRLIFGDNPKDQSSTNEKAKDLEEKLENVKELSSKACIFKVHEMLRKANPEAYTPLTISIGPYHHGKPELRKMERLKQLYTNFFLQARTDVGVEGCWEILKGLQSDAESYYGDDIDEEVSGDEFVKMLLLDGCFIVEFVIRLSDGQEYENDPIDTMIRGIESDIVRDMLLLENQLPFFVLQALYDMICNLPDKPEFSETVKIAFRSEISEMNSISLFNTEVNGQEIKHLLQIVHILCKPQSQNNGQIQQQKECSSSSCSFWKQPQVPDIESRSLSNGQDRWQFFTCFLSKFWEQPQQIIDDDDAALLCSIRTASELQEAGVDFKKVGNISKDHNSNETISLFDIKFNNNGVLEIPSFALFDLTETFIRNLIAYEQHSRDVRPMYFSDYSKFMDDLINTEKDVNLLRLKDVFINGLGNDKKVTRHLNIGVLNYSNNFYYKDVCKELNRHCKKPRNVLMAKLRRDYFHSPWAGISTFAAILLLSLAIAQTVLSGLDLHK